MPECNLFFQEWDVLPGERAEPGHEQSLHTGALEIQEEREEWGRIGQGLVQSVPGLRKLHDQHHLLPHGPVQGVRECDCSEEF